MPCFDLCELQFDRYCMDTAGYIGLSHQAALQHQLNVISNNLSNLSTTGFQRQDLLFQSYIERQAITNIPAARNVAFVRDVGVTRDASPGDLVTTQGPLDAAIEGDGYFVVDLGGGQQAYTRNGKFGLSSDGTLVTLSGQPVLDTNGRPIKISPTDSDVHIGGDGHLSSDSRDIGQIAVVQFPPNGLEQRGDNLLIAQQGATPTPVATPHLHAGALEGSNVKPILELSRMMALVRAYESTNKLLDGDDQLHKRAIEQLGRFQ